MKKRRVPIDCKRLTEAHLRGLSRDELAEVVERIELQRIALDRARRLVGEAWDRTD